MSKLPPPPPIRAITNEAQIAITVKYDGCNYTLVEALKHITGLIEDGYTSGGSKGENASFSFTVEDKQK